MSTQRGCALVTGAAGPMDSLRGCLSKLSWWGQADSLPLYANEAGSSERAGQLGARGEERAQPEGAVPRSYNVLLSRLATMLMLTAFLAAATLITFFFTRSSSQETVGILGNALRRNLLGRTEDQLLSLLNEQARCAKSFAHSLDEYWSIITWEKGNHSLAVDAMTSNTLLNCGQLLGALWSSPGGMARLDTLAPPANSSFLSIFSNETVPTNVTPVSYVDVRAKASERVIQDAQLLLPPIDFRNQSYYRNALASPSGTTMQLEVAVTGEPSLVMADRIGDSPEQGIVAVCMALSAVSDYLANLDLQKGLIYVTSGALLMASSMEGDSGHVNASLALMPAAQSVHTLIRASALSLGDKLTGYTGGAYSLSQARLLGVKYFVDTQALQYRDTDLTIVMVLPRSSIMGKIDEKATVTAVAIAVSTAGIGILGCFLVILLTSPVSGEIRLKRELIRQLAAKKKAEEKNETKSRFLANMSHELRTPMASIIGLLDLLIDDSLTPGQRITAGQVRECALGLLGLLNNLLDFSKIEAGKMDLERTEFDLVGLLENLADILSVQSAKKGVELALDLPDGIGPLVYGDPSRVRQIFTNLINNAIKFTQVGHVLLSCRQEPAQPNWLIFDVEDTGCGIPKERTSSVFEAFVQADESTTRLYGGTGLGLTIVKSLVELMGASIAVEEKDEPGALFRVCLPLCAPGTCHEGSKSGHSTGLYRRGVAPDVVVKARALSCKSDSRGQPLNEGFKARRCSEPRRESGAGRSLHGLEKSPPALIAPIGSPGDKAGDAYHVENPPQEQRLQPAVGETPNPFQGAGVLLVKRATVGRQIATSLLEERGLRVRSLEDWEAALAAVRQSVEASRLPRENQRQGQEPLPPSLGIGVPLTGHDGQGSGQGSGPLPLLAQQEGRCASDAAALFRFELVLIDISLIAGADVRLLEQHLAQLRSALDLPPLPKKAHLRDTHEDPDHSGSDSSESAEEAPDKQRADLPGHVPHVVWLVGNEVTAYARRLLREQGLGAILHKPIFRSRVRAMLDEFAAKPALPLSKLAPIALQPLALDMAPTSAKSSPRTSKPATPTKGAVSTRAVDEFKHAQYKVLIAEDTPLLRQLAQTVLARLNARVTAVENGQQAVAAVMAANLSERAGEATEAFDFVLMDCQMPVMDGYAATRVIRAAEAAGHVPLSQRLPILALTAHAMAEDEARCKAAGMDHYMTKPLQIAKLTELAVMCCPKSR